MVQTAVPGPRLRVGSSECASTSPSSVTRPAATTEPPRSTPIAGPVGLGARLAHEVIGRPEAAFARGRTHEIILAPHGHLEGPSEIQDKVENGLVPAHMVVGIEMCGEPSHDGPKGIDLGAELDARLVSLGARGGLARVADEPALRIH